jgi:hypothetical protein
VDATFPSDPLLGKSLRDFEPAADLITAFKFAGNCAHCVLLNVQTYEPALLPAPRQNDFFKKLFHAVRQQYLYCFRVH